jgi:hypothetical protein
MLPLMILRGVIMKRFVEGADRGQSEYATDTTAQDIRDVLNK